MGRPSKLTDPMKVEIGRRIAAGEPIRALAREFKVAESTLRGIFSAQIPKIQAVANAMVNAERDLAALPLTAQKSALGLAEQLRAISDNLAMAALEGSATAARLATAARKQADLINPDTLENVGNVATVMMLTETANKAAAPALTLVAAQAKDKTPPPPGVLTVVTGVPDAE